VNNQIRNDQVSLSLLVSAVWKYKVWLLLTFVITAAVSSYLSLQLPNTYRSEAKLIAADTGNKGTGLSGQLSTVSALAGINLGGGGEKKSVLALEMMRSREFFAAFAEKYQLLVPLMAVEGWDPTSNQLMLDEKIYDIKNQRWHRKVSDLRLEKPSMLEAHETFMKMFSSSQDKVSGVVSLGLEYVSPELSQKWLGLYIDEINEVTRQRDISESESAIFYLNQQLDQAHLAEVRNLLFGMIEEHTKTLTMANVRKDYVFKVIDSPYLPEVKAGPVRSLIVLLALFVNLFLFVVAIMANLVFRAAKSGSVKVREGIHE
jgi:LPS O-antigen subunit length determinant protein (WzzB/FepE family)